MIFASSPTVSSVLSQIITGVSPVTMVVEVTEVVVAEEDEVVVVGFSEVVVVAFVVVVVEVDVVVVVVVVVGVVTGFSSIAAMLGTPSPHQSQRSAVRYLLILSPFAEVHVNTLS